MLRQKQANLLESLYKVVLHRKGIVVAENFLMSLLDQDAVTRPAINSFISSFLGNDVYVNTYLRYSDLSKWLSTMEEVVIDDLISKYEEGLTWYPIENKRPS